MRTTHRRLTAAILVVVLSAACGGRLTVNTTVKQVSQNGTALMQVVTAMATAVITAERDGVLSRNKAVAVMSSLKQITDASTKVVELLGLLVAVNDAREAKMYTDGIARLLEVISTGIFQALLPIDDVTLKTDIGLLAVEMGRTMTLINRDILGRTTLNAK